MERPILVLCVDRDNDLYEKAKIKGPIIGRAANVDAAMKLSLADPEDPDANAMFYAVKVYDDMKREGHNVEVVTLTGDKKLGYTSDKALGSQLDRVVGEINPVSCILISDGAADEEIIPVIKSRIRIDSTKIVFIKQAKELEKTYFVLIEKLKDPHYAKIILGIPALLLVLASLSSYFGFGWQPVVALAGIYLLLRVYGVDELAMRIVKDFNFSIERTSWISYIGGFTLILIAILIGYQSYESAMSLALAPEKVIASILRSVAGLLLTAVIFMMVGKAIDALAEKRTFDITRYALYSIGATLAMLVLKVGSDWVLNISPPYVSFSDFLLTLMVSIVLGYVSTTIISWIRADMLLRMKLDGKEAVSEHGAYIGKVVGVDPRKSALVILTVFDKKFTLPFSSVSSVGDNVIMKTGQ